MCIVVVREDIRDFLNGAAENRSGRGTRPSGCDGISTSYGLDRFGRQPVFGRKMDELPVEPEDVAELSLAEGSAVAVCCSSASLSSRVRALSFFSSWARESRIRPTRVLFFVPVERTLRT